MNQAMQQLRAKVLLRDKVLISGEWRNARSGRMLDVTDPATAEVLVRVPDCDERDTKSAIRGASGALAPWGALAAQARAATLQKWHDLILLHADDLALLMTLEQGKPLPEANSEVHL